jgi:hypothetical protein
MLGVAAVALCLGALAWFWIPRPSGDPSQGAPAASELPTITLPGKAPAAPAVLPRTSDLTASATAIDVAAMPTTEWVGIHDPSRAYAGYTLALFNQRVPMVLDMAGRVVHSWPTVRVVSRANLNPDGSLTFIAPDDHIREVSWDGEVNWEYATEREHYFPHHDFDRLDDGTVVALYKDRATHTDDVVFIDRDGTVRQTWKSNDHLRHEFLETPHKERDLTHLNSVQVLPENKWYADGDERFRPGNVLISGRHLDGIFIFDPTTSAVVWRYKSNLDWQHEAIMTPLTLPDSGRIMIFNNRANDPARSTEVIEIDPTTEEVLWRYRSETFFTDIAGLGQKLPNGNVLISSSRGGRSFEVDAATGDVVWQWNPPYDVMRPHRYAPDYCPQLAAMTPEPSPAVQWAAPGPYVDETLHEYAVSLNAIRARVGDENKRRMLLPKGNSCSVLRMPASPMVLLEYGFGTRGRTGTATTTGSLTVTLREDQSSDSPEILFDRTVTLEEDGDWARERVRVSKDWSNKKVEMCVRSTAEDLAGDAQWPKGFVVGEPKIKSTAGPRRGGLPDLRRSADRPNVLDPSTERADDHELTMRQLEELGYVE